MRIGFISFRLAGTDGVSLETAKLAAILHRLGHEIFAFAGELDEPAIDLDPLHVPLAGRKRFGLAHFTHPDIVWITEHAFREGPWGDDLRLRMGRAAAILTDALRAFVNQYALDLIVPENVFAIPLNLPLSLALKKVVAESGIPTVAHHHDFYWERAQYAAPAAADLLRQTFPPDLPNIRHLVINSAAQRALADRGIDSQVLPNILDFSAKPPGPDTYNAELREDLGLSADEIFFLQPTRVIRRKAIERSIELAARLDDLPIHLVISHHAEQTSLDYLAELRDLADRSHVRLTYAPDRFGPYRTKHPDRGKVYSFWDAYAQADFVTYPSTYEGWGNALLEAVYMRRPLLVNRYPVFRQDIEPTGLRTVTIDGQITDETVASVRQLLRDPDSVTEMTEHNFAVASRHYSYAFAQSLLENVIQSFDRSHA
jgi:glycosyltransferase involved in cell wall biosynthesis